MKPPRTDPLSVMLDDLFSRHEEGDVLTQLCDIKSILESYPECACEQSLPDICQLACALSRAHDRIVYDSDCFNMVRYVYKNAKGIRPFLRMMSVLYIEGEEVEVNLSKAAEALYEVVQ
jgi:hypothetical protein